MQGVSHLSSSDGGAEQQDRVIRIARAMCRAKRLNPDLPIALSPPEFACSRLVVDAVVGSDTPLWLLFVDDAKRFIASNRDYVSML